jgi:late competence protein required for DNA uptake (superfamily II DNA/RNA helicase)
LKKELKEGHSENIKSLSKSNKISSKGYVKCAICMNTFAEDQREKVKLACTHTYHEECVAKKGKQV